MNKIALQENKILAENVISREFMHRGYDIIEKQFFVEEHIVYMNNARQTEKTRAITFDCFKSYFEYLGGDIYSEACYYGYAFMKEDVKDFSIDVKKINYISLVDDTIDNYSLDFSKKESEECKNGEAQKRKFLKWQDIFGLDKSRLLDLSGVVNYAADSGRQVFLFTDNIQMLTRIGRGCRINIVEDERKIMDEKQLYKGVFWIADLENISANRAYCFKIPCDVQGYPADSTLNLNAKGGLTYNHRLLWEMLDSKLTGGKPYNYYPRGRVEIRNGTARIYLNGNINTEEIISFLVEEFNLTAENGITQVVAKTDNGTHYLCHLDGGYKGDNKRKGKK